MTGSHLASMSSLHYDSNIRPILANESNCLHHSNLQSVPGSLVSNCFNPAQYYVRPPTCVNQPVLSMQHQLPYPVLSNRSSEVVQMNNFNCETGVCDLGTHETILPHFVNIHANGDLSSLNPTGDSNFNVFSDGYLSRDLGSNQSDNSVQMVPMFTQPDQVVRMQTAKFNAMNVDVNNKQQYFHGYSGFSNNNHTDFNNHGDLITGNSTHTNSISVSSHNRFLAGNVRSLAHEINNNGCHNYSLTPDYFFNGQYASVPTDRTVEQSGNSVMSPQYSECFNLKILPNILLFICVYIYFGL